MQKYTGLALLEFHPFAIEQIIHTRIKEPIDNSLLLYHKPLFRLIFTMGVPSCRQSRAPFLSPHIFPFIGNKEGIYTLP